MDYDDYLPDDEDAFFRYMMRKGIVGMIAFTILALIVIWT